MQPAPQVQQWLEQLHTGGAPALNTLSIEDARAAYCQLSVQFGGPSLEMASVDMLTAQGPAGDIPLRRYRPIGLDVAQAPTLLYFHGGGWVIGDLDSHDKVCRHIAGYSGCQVVSVGYRLAPEYPAPAAAVDAIAALIWVVEHSDIAGRRRNVCRPAGAK
ncbi:alpha/beta hydrolase [Sodalis sp. dw_96]|uniref:alpha/beta hydrolase fold domain-containing protein n=1 Tax=Sodalis sp. dw_96 TaxID=2719794 RepID=UPI001BD43DB3|nr:alpha/beta hydrolase [Sodalis sp. dw_96]